MMGMIGRIFRLLALVGGLAIAAPIWIALLLFALMVSTAIGLYLFLVLRNGLTGMDSATGPDTVFGVIGMMLCLLPAWAAALVIWAQYCGLSGFFARRGVSHGSARFATPKERAAYQGADGLLIGRDLETGRLLRYDGPAHLLTLAPTRAGKGVGTVIPNLLTVPRPVLVIDPKGENAMIAAGARQRFGAVHILDPFGVTGLPASAYSPLGQLDPESLDLGEDAASLAEALVIDPPGQVSEAHWNEEAKALLAGLIMFAVAHEDQDRKPLPFMAIFGLVLVLGLGLGLSRFMADNPATCWIIGGQMLVSPNGDPACVLVG